LLEFSHASLEFSDVDSDESGISFRDEDIGSLQVYTAISHAFYFFAIELHTCLILLDNLVVEESLFIVREDDFFLSFLHVSPSIREIEKNQLARVEIYDKI
jgi:hypothetical protein